MQNKLKAKLHEGEKVIGTMSQLGCPTAIECLGIAALDFFIIDMEHAAIGNETMRSLIMACEKYPITPLVRIPVISKDAIAKALDSGSGGLIVPAVENVEQVRDLVRFAKYPPDGIRGFSMIRTAAYGNDEIAKDPNKYFSHFNAETLVIPQCETLGCLDNIEEIVAIPGVDGIFIGPYDLSTALGRPADFSNSEFQSAVKKVLNTCRAKEKFSFMLSSSPEQTSELFDKGFSGVVFSIDINMLINAYKSALRAEAGKQKPDDNTFASYLAQLG